MRAGELLGRPVLDVDGQWRGSIIDIRTRAQARQTEGVTLVLDGFVVGTHRWRLFGYERRDERGPLLFTLLVRRIHRNTRYVPITDADLDGEHGVRLRRRWEDLPGLHEIRR